MANSREFDCSRVWQFEASNKNLYEKASPTPESAATKYNNEQMVMPNKPEQKLSNPSAEEEFTQVLKAFQLKLLKVKLLKFL